MPAAVPPATGSQRTKRESALAGGGVGGRGWLLADQSWPELHTGLQAGKAGKARQAGIPMPQHSTAQHRTPIIAANFTTLHVPLSFHPPLASVEALSFALLLLAWPDCPACLAFSLRSPLSAM